MAPGYARGEEIPAGMARLTFARPPVKGRPVLTLELWIDGQEAAKIGNGEWAGLLVEAGDRTIEVAEVIAGARVPRLSFTRLVAVGEGKDVYVENVKPTAISVDFSDLFSIQEDVRLNYSALTRVPALYSAVYADGSHTLVGEAPHAPKSVASARAEPQAPMQAREPDSPPNAPANRSSPFSSNVLAVVIGNRDYQRGTSAAAYAVNDARAFRDLLEKRLGIGEKDITYLENAGLADMISIFGGSGGYKKSRIYRMASLRENPPDLIVYYSGHGAPATSGLSKGEGYLVPVDADLQAVQDTGYSIDMLLDNVEAMKDEGVLGRSWLSFDACFSGQSGDGSLLVRNVSGLAVRSVSPRSYPQDSLVMFASSGEEFASWYPDQGHGLFTFFLLKGLSGEADTDGDGEISVAEISSYLRKWVPRYANGLNAQDQTPQVLEEGSMDGFLKVGFE